VHNCTVGCQVGDSGGRRLAVGMQALCCRTHRSKLSRKPLARDGQTSKHDDRYGFTHLTCAALD